MSLYIGCFICKIRNLRIFPMGHFALISYGSWVHMFFLWCKETSFDVSSYDWRRHTIAIPHIWNPVDQRLSYPVWMLEVGWNFGNWNYSLSNICCLESNRIGIGMGAQFYRFCWTRTTMELDPYEWKWSLYLFLDPQTSSSVMLPPATPVERRPTADLPPMASPCRLTACGNSRRPTATGVPPLAWRCSPDPLPSRRPSSSLWHIFYFPVADASSSSSDHSSCLLAHRWCPACQIPNWGLLHAIRGLQSLRSPPLQIHLSTSRGHIWSKWVKFSFDMRPLEPFEVIRVAGIGC
jgi:hypothetical protein